MTADQRDFLRSKTFAVAGASNNREKYGNIVYRALRDFARPDRDVYPIHPSLDHVESDPAFSSVADLPLVPEALSIVTPPLATRQIVTAAIEAGMKTIWMQPGAEDDQAIAAARGAGITVIAGGPCILVAMKIL
jgi:predicted CoA-binding protein